jgi:hypothetical protein
LRPSGCGLDFVFKSVADCYRLAQSGTFDFTNVAENIFAASIRGDEKESPSFDHGFNGTRLAHKSSNVLFDNDLPRWRLDCVAGMIFA